MYDSEALCSKAPSGVPAGQRVKGVMAYHEVVKKLKAMSNPEAVAGMARFGINPENALGISIPDLRRMAKETGKGDWKRPSLGPKVMGLRDPRGPYPCRND